MFILIGTEFSNCLDIHFIVLTPLFISSPITDTSTWLIQSAVSIYFVACIESFVITLYVSSINFTFFKICLCNLSENLFAFAKGLLKVCHSIPLASFKAKIRDCSIVILQHTPEVSNFPSKNPITITVE